jgi:chromosome partitioning protein
MVVSFLNLKGGVGKSTLAVHFAVWLRMQGKHVAVVDADAQHSASLWLQEAEPSVRIFPLHDPDDIVDQVPRLAKQFDSIVIDVPPQLSELSRVTLLRSDIAIVICGPGALDVQASSAAVRVVRQAQDIRGGQPKALFVPNKIQVNTILSADLLETATEIGIPMVKVPVRLRQVYADAPGQGTTVFRMGPRAKVAAEELNALFEEVVNG